MDRRGAFSDIALERVLSTSTAAAIADRHLATELVYGITRHQRTLDALISRFSRRPAEQQPPDLRRILQIGLYQLRYLDRIPAAASVDTAVELAHTCQLGRLTGVANGVLRAYLRTPAEEVLPPLPDPVANLGLQYSYPDWLVQQWWEQLGAVETEALCRWFNQPPTIDLRVNSWRCDVDTVQATSQAVGIEAMPVEGVPGALRLSGHVGAIADLPGFAEGWWTVQDSSAQEVVHLLDPKPGELVIDCCAAPGGKTTHIAERMQNVGQIWAIDRHAGRLKRAIANAKRLQLTCIETKAIDLATCEGDPDLPPVETADRVLVDAPCSGLGTLHRHADARWRQTPQRIAELTSLQARILDRAASWVKPGGILVYSTCTLTPEENQQQVKGFLSRHPEWQLATDVPLRQIWPQRHNRDGFFTAKLQLQT
jgi:16S rRNA (cytosine967-C5)-methyltransferase